jgi:hypothetical protein
MSKMDDRLNEILGVREGGGLTLDEQLDGLRDESARETFEVVEYKDVESKVIEASVNEDALEDYKYSRKILYGLIERGTAMLDGALMVAKESENPRAYETASNIMNNVNQMAKSLIELQKALNPKGAKIIKADTINVQNNNQTYITEPVDPDAGVANMLDSLDDE